MKKLLLTGFLLASNLWASAALITLSWDAVPTATGYKVYLGQTNGAFTATNDVGNVTNCQVTLSESSPYYFALTSYNVNGLESDLSNPCLISASPAGFNVMAAVRKDNITMAWSPAAGATHYTLYYGKSTNAVDRLHVDVAAPGTSTTVSVPPGTTTLYCRLVAVTGNEVGPNLFTNASFAARLDLSWPGTPGLKWSTQN